MTEPSKAAVELAQAFYQAKVPDGRWKSIPQSARDAYVDAMDAVLKCPAYQQALDTAHNEAVKMVLARIDKTRMPMFHSEIKALMRKP